MYMHATAPSSVVTFNADLRESIAALARWNGTDIATLDQVAALVSSARARLPDLVDDADVEAAALFYRLASTGFDAASRSASIGRAAEEAGDDAKRAAAAAAGARVGELTSAVASVVGELMLRATYTRG